MAMPFDPFTELDRPTAGLLGTRQGPKFMPVDLYRDGDRYILNADMPGIEPGSVDIDVDGQLLTIRANRTPDTRDGVKWLTQERPHGSYLRQFSVGEGVDSDAITAHYDNGVLSLMTRSARKPSPARSKSPPGRPPNSASVRPPSSTPSTADPYR